MAGHAVARDASRNPAQAAWAGPYRDEWLGGRMAGGSGIAVAYALRMGGGVSDCALDVTGYQSDRHILCQVGAAVQEGLRVLDCRFIP